MLKVLNAKGKPNVTGTEDQSVLNIEIGIITLMTPPTNMEAVVTKNPGSAEDTTQEITTSVTLINSTTSILTAILAAILTAILTAITTKEEAVEDQEVVITAMIYTIVLEVGMMKILC